MNETVNLASRRAESGVGYSDSHSGQTGTDIALDLINTNSIDLTQPATLSGHTLTQREEATLRTLADDTSTVEGVLAECVRVGPQSFPALY